MEFWLNHMIMLGYLGRHRIRRGGRSSPASGRAPRAAVAPQPRRCGPCWSTARNPACAREAAPDGDLEALPVIHGPGGSPAAKAGSARPGGWRSAAAPALRGLGADGGTRTRTPRRAEDFKSPASTGSATSARMLPCHQVGQGGSIGFRCRCAKARSRPARRGPGLRRDDE